MPEHSPGWVAPVMRTGYAARALVYAIVGGLALGAALHGGETQGTTDALADLRGQGWGVPLIWAVAVGLWAYMVWRLIDAWMDLDDYGSGLKGLVARTGLVITGLIHGAIGVSVAGIALGGGEGGGSGTERVIQWAMALENGSLMVATVGIATLGAGTYYGWKGIGERYKRHIRVTALTRRLDPVMKVGCVAMGVVIYVIGLSILYAAAQADPNAAAGLGQALDAIRSAPFGRILLALVAAGLIGFAVENLVEAIFRVVPRYSAGDETTLAERARRRVRRVVAAV